MEGDHVTYLSKSGGMINNCLWVDNRHKSGVICVYSKVREEDKICILTVKSVERVKIYTGNWEVIQEEG